MNADMEPRRIDWPEGVLCVRSGPGGNCSSIGSAVHLLFASGVLAGVVAVVAAALAPAGGGTQQDQQPESGPDREPPEGQEP